MSECELEPHQERRGEGGKLERRLPPWDKRKRKRSCNQDHLQDPLEPAEVGRPCAWYWPQSHNENGDRRSNWISNVRSVEPPKLLDRLSARNKNPERERGRYCERGGEGGRPPPLADVRIGRPERDDDERRKLRPGGERSGQLHGRRQTTPPQKPQIRNAGMIASFALELDTYCVNGFAAHANAKTAASRVPPKRRPTAARPRASTSKSRVVNRTAGRRPDFPAPAEDGEARKVCVVIDGPIGVAERKGRLATPVRLDPVRNVAVRRRRTAGPAGVTLGEPAVGRGAIRYPLGSDHAGDTPHRAPRPARG